MNLTNKEVRHRQFGDGVVTGQSASTVTVQFSEQYGEKRFLYPDAFVSFLTLDSPDLDEQMGAELRAICEQLEGERSRREEETEQRQNEERLALLEEKRVTAKKRAAERKAALKSKA